MICLRIGIKDIFISKKVKNIENIKLNKNVEFVKDTIKYLKDKLHLKEAMDQDKLEAVIQLCKTNSISIQKNGLDDNDVIINLDTCAKNFKTNDGRSKSIIDNQHILPHLSRSISSGLKTSQTNFRDHHDSFMSFKNYKDKNLRNMEFVARE
mmetsp:Transcript_8454/g.7466  ORF Transcript_8454/g.7466 Transcript_8454/m.7466 type:complete len:152 (+) Transcript_8454:109-564(+)